MEKLMMSWLTTTYSSKGLAGLEDAETFSQVSADRCVFWEMGLPLELGKSRGFPLCCLWQVLEYPFLMIHPSRMFLSYPSSATLSISNILLFFLKRDLSAYIIFSNMDVYTIYHLSHLLNNLFGQCIIFFNIFSLVCNCCLPNQTGGFLRARGHCF